MTCTSIPFPRAFDAAVTAAPRPDVVVLVTVGPGTTPLRSAGTDHTSTSSASLAQSLVMRHTKVIASHAGSGTVLAASGRRSRACAFPKRRPSPATPQR